MPNRIIKESIRTSRSINTLSDFQFRLWAYLITYVDDFGRGSADPELLKGLCFPRRKGVTEVQIAKALSEMATIGIIDLYDVGGESYFLFPSWEKHQQIRAKKSKFPAPAGGLIAPDISCEQMISDENKCPRNPIQSESNPNTNPNESNARVPRFTPPSLEEISAYCLERKNSVDPEAFYAFYASKGWKVGREPMKDWKAAVITWEKRENEESKKPHFRTNSKNFPVANSHSMPEVDLNKLRAAMNKI